MQAISINNALYSDALTYAEQRKEHLSIGQTLSLFER